MIDSINSLMQRIWIENTQTGYIKTNVQLNSDEWQLILQEWPKIYGASDFFKKQIER